MEPRIPICRYLTICTDGRVTAAGEVELLNPLHALMPPSGRRYPAIVPSLYLFAQMTAGWGPHVLAAELLRWFEGQTYQVFRTPNTPHDFGRDRAGSHNFHLRLTPVIFPTAGQYTVLLLCDGTESGRAELELLVPT